MKQIDHRHKDDLHLLSTIQDHADKPLSAMDGTLWLEAKRGRLKPKMTSESEPEFLCCFNTNLLRERAVRTRNRAPLF